MASKTAVSDELDQTPPAGGSLLFFRVLQSVATIKSQHTERLCNLAPGTRMATIHRGTAAVAATFLWIDGEA